MHGVGQPKLSVLIYKCIYIRSDDVLLKIGYVTSYNSMPTFTPSPHSQRLMIANQSV